MTPDARRALGRAVKSHRVSHGLTQRELGELVFCSQATISKIERGSAAVDDTVRARIESALDLESGQLLVECGSIAPSTADPELARRVRALELAIQTLTCAVYDLVRTETGDRRHRLDKSHASAGELTHAGRPSSEHGRFPYTRRHSDIPHRRPTATAVRPVP